jgi:hypothetical protein
VTFHPELRGRAQLVPRFSLGPSPTCEASIVVPTSWAPSSAYRSALPPPPRSAQIVVGTLEDADLEHAVVLGLSIAPTVVIGLAGVHFVAR